MGSGKTHWGRIWAKKYSLDFVDLDERIETTAGSTVAQIFETLGEEHFRKLEADALRSCASLEKTIIACGGGTPCFHDNMSWMNENGLTIYITSQPHEILQRVSEEKDKRPLLKNHTPEGLLRFIEQKIEEREPFYRQAKYILSSSRLAAGTLQTILPPTALQ
jgi:shikimate kinase